MSGENLAPDGDNSGEMKGVFFVSVWVSKLMSQKLYLSIKDYLPPVLISCSSFSLLLLLSSDLSPLLSSASLPKFGASESVGKRALLHKKLA